LCRPQQAADDLTQVGLTEQFGDVLDLAAQTREPIVGEVAGQRVDPLF
jgi:hypothetical protein